MISSMRSAPSASRNEDSSGIGIYDANGSISEDALTGWGLSYNILNLLSEYMQDNRG